VWFDQATKERQRIEELVDSMSFGNTEEVRGTASTLDDEVRGNSSGSGDHSTDGLKNVRWTVEQEEDNFSTLLEVVTGSPDNDRLGFHSSPVAEPGLDRQPTKAPANVQDYQMQLMLLEQQRQNRQRLAENEVYRISKGQQPNKPNKPPGALKRKYASIVSDVDMHLRLLEQQRRNRLLIARQEADDIREESQPVHNSPIDNQQYPSTSPATLEPFQASGDDDDLYEDTIEDGFGPNGVNETDSVFFDEREEYQRELQLFEQTRKKRLLMDQQEANNIP
jgi:hypothetical protein